MAKIFARRAVCTLLLFCACITCYSQESPKLPHEIEKELEAIFDGGSELEEVLKLASRHKTLLSSDPNLIDRLAKEIEENYALVKQMPEGTSNFQARQMFVQVQLLRALLPATQTQIENLLNRAGADLKERRRHEVSLMIMMWLGPTGIERLITLITELGPEQGPSLRKDIVRGFEYWPYFMPEILKITLPEETLRKLVQLVFDTVNSDITKNSWHISAVARIVGGTPLAKDEPTFKTLLSVFHELRKLNDSGQSNAMVAIGTMHPGNPLAQKTIEWLIREIDQAIAKSEREDEFWLEKYIESLCQILRMETSDASRLESLEGLLKDATLANALIASIEKMVNFSLEKDRLFRLSGNYFDLLSHLGAPGQHKLLTFLEDENSHVVLKRWSAFSIRDLGLTMRSSAMFDRWQTLCIRLLEKQNLENYLYRHLLDAAIATGVEPRYVLRHLLKNAQDFGPTSDIKINRLHAYEALGRMKVINEQTVKTLLYAGRQDPSTEGKSIAWEAIKTLGISAINASFPDFVNVVLKIYQEDENDRVLRAIEFFIMKDSEFIKEFKDQVPASQVHLFAVVQHGFKMDRGAAILDWLGLLGTAAGTTEIVEAMILVVAEDGSNTNQSQWPSCRILAAEVLRNIGPAANAALPKLKEIRDDQNTPESLREAVVEAIKKIDVS
jgi:hypothetical protein